MRTDFDVLIVGGGLVGASLAYALRDSRLAVGMVEAFPPAVSAAPSFDDRTLALSQSSRRVFQAMGLWEAVERRGAAPIKRIHISDRGRFGVTRLRAADAGLDALGYVVTHHALGATLYEAIQTHGTLTLIAPAVVQSVSVGEAVARVQVQADGAMQVLSARLLVAADGANSPVRAAMGIESQRVPYEQTAIVTAVSPERAHEGTAYERFTASGPLALLPAAADRMAVVWTVAADQVQHMLRWDDETFCEALQSAFGERLGRFLRVGKRQAFPLALMEAREQVRARLVLIGNAAHGVHPVAGQGFNLGLRDVAALAEILTDGIEAGSDPGEPMQLQRYAEWRARDNRVTSAFTHSLIRIFSNDYLPVTVGRNLGLTAVDVLPPLKRRLIRLTSGLAGRLPRLARGLPLRPPVR